MQDSPVTVEPLEEGAYWRVVLDRPKANIIDASMTASLTWLFGEARKDRDLKAVCFEGAGSHFSFGASVEEHQPEQVASMLGGFHNLFRTILDSGVVCLAAVRGQCLGGGLELAAFCQRVFAAPDAKLGQPEIVLGVFAPVASIILRERMGAGGAEDLCLTGRSVGAEEALGAGLVDEIADDPAAAAHEYARTSLLRHSAASLRHAARAVRFGMGERFRAEIEGVERLYLDELMATDDAKEGIRAFLEKRKPEWTNR